MATTAGTAASYVAVTPSDSAPLQGPCVALYIGVSGDVTLKQNAGAAAVTFKSVPVGILSVGAYQVMSTGTTATNMLALY